MGIAIAALVIAVIGAGTFFVIKSKFTPATPEAPDRDRFAKAFTPVPVAPAPAKGATLTSGGAQPGSRTEDVAPPEMPPIDGGDSTMQVKFVPDTSVAPIPGFADIYKKIALGQIRGHVMVVGGPDKGKGVELKGDAPITVGREKNHTLNLTDPGVSTHQCEIVVSDGKVLVRDIGSRNGTYVNNQKVDQRELENCDIVTMGKTKILVTLPG